MCPKSGVKFLGSCGKNRDLGKNRPRNHTLTSNLYKNKGLLTVVCSFHMIQEQTRKPHPNPKLLEKLWIVDGGPFFLHDPISFYVCIACVFINFIIFFYTDLSFSSEHYNNTSHCQVSTGMAGEKGGRCSDKGGP